MTVTLVLVFQVIPNHVETLYRVVCMRTWALGLTTAQIATPMAESLYLVGLVLPHLRTRAHGPTIAHIRWVAQTVYNIREKTAAPV